MLLLNPALGDRLLVGSTDQLLEAFTPPEEPTLQPAQWLEVSEEERRRGMRLRICHSKVCDGQGRERTCKTWSGRQPALFFSSQ